MKVRGRTRVLVLLSAVSILSIMSLLSVLGQSSVPLGPDAINISDSGRFQNGTNPVPVQAKAGNVTALTIDSTRVTEAWQGYYGNITGSITLDDADNFTFYDWVITDPQGEVYAANESFVTWADVYCINTSQNGTNPIKPDGTATNTNWSDIELRYGINVSDADGLNETYTGTYTDTTGFHVGPVLINNEDDCTTASPYVDDAASSTWTQLLLSDNNSIIFTGLILDDGNNFQAGTDSTADFQLMVLENGHVGHEEIVTTYYFFVELA